MRAALWTCRRVPIRGKDDAYRMDGYLTSSTFKTNCPASEINRYVGGITMKAREITRKQVGPTECKCHYPPDNATYLPSTLDPSCSRLGRRVANQKLVLRRHRAVQRICSKYRFLKCRDEATCTLSTILQLPSCPSILPQLTHKNDRRPQCSQPRQDSQQTDPRLFEMRPP